MSYQFVASAYTHTQVDANTTWTIIHNLGQLLPIVDCWITYNSENTNIIPSSITIVDNNTITVIFSTAQSGYASVI